MEAWLHIWKAARGRKPGPLGKMVAGIGSHSEPVTIAIRTHDDTGSAEEFLSDKACLDALTQSPHPCIIRIHDAMFDLPTLMSGIAMEVSVTNLAKYLAGRSYKASPALAR